MPNVIDNSIEAEEHPDYKKVNRKRNIENGVDDINLLVHRMYGAVQIDGKIYRVKTTMHEHYKNGNAPHDYKVTKIELIISGSSTSNALNSSNGRSNIFVSGAKLLQNVEKSYEKGKKLLDASREADKTTMPKPLNNEDRSAAVEAARGVGEQLGGIGVDVKRINKGRGVPMLEVNSIKTVFAHHGEIGGKEELIAWDKNITPEQEALLRGHNFREYPTIQELSAANINNNIEKTKLSDKKYPLNNEERSAAVEAARGVGEQLGGIGVEVKRINKGRGVPMLEVNSIKTVFAHHGEIGGKEELIAWDKNITPEQEALLRGLNYHEYPTIQELSAANINNNIEKTKLSDKKYPLNNEDRSAAVEAARGVGEQLGGIGVEVVLNGEATDADKTLTEEQRLAKGWYDPSTGKVYLNASRIESAEDAVRTRNGTDRIC